MENGQKNRPLMRVTCFNVSNKKLLARTYAHILIYSAKLSTAMTIKLRFVNFNSLTFYCTFTLFLARSERESSNNCYSNE